VTQKKRQIKKRAVRNVWSEEKDGRYFFRVFIVFGSSGAFLFCVRDGKTQARKKGKPKKREKNRVVSISFFMPVNNFQFFPGFLVEFCFRGATGLGTGFWLRGVQP
jgi:hypothetical protein